MRNNFLVFLVANVLGDVYFGLYYWLLMQVRIYYCIIIHFLSTTKQIIGAYTFVIIILDTKILGEEALTYHMLVRHVLNTFTWNWLKRKDGKRIIYWFPYHHERYFKISFPYYERDILLLKNTLFIKNIFFIDLCFMYNTFKILCGKMIRTIIYHTTHFLFLLIYTIFLRNT